MICRQAASLRLACRKVSILCNSFSLIGLEAKSNLPNHVALLRLGGLGISVSTQGRAVVRRQWKYITVYDKLNVADCQLNLAIVLRHYSFLSEFTGLACAALNACVLTINNAKINAMAPVTGKIHQAISVRIA
jgi:hypothetical protein